MIVLPGNSSYSDITTRGKRICILSDIICRRIKMMDFNDAINNGSAHLTAFPGATAKQLHHYIILILLDQSLDTVIIHVGTNSLTYTKPLDTVNEILDIVKRCHSYGINNVYVSSHIRRTKYQKEIDIINKYLQANHLVYDYVFIDNCNIKDGRFRRDKLHPNDIGTTVLAKKIFLFK